jgi:uncharacterized protein YjeT (DUF2065 family)
MSDFICLIGMVMIVEGLPYFAFPEKIKQWLVKLIETPDPSLRRMGLALMMVGLLLIWVGRRLMTL